MFQDLLENWQGEKGDLRRHGKDFRILSVLEGFRQRQHYLTDLAAVCGVVLRARNTSWQGPKLAQMWIVILRHRDWGRAEAWDEGSICWTTIIQ